MCGAIAEFRKNKSTKSCQSQALQRLTSPSVHSESSILHDQRNALLLAQQKGMEAGLKAGLEKGLEEGREEGREEGERLKAIAIARQLMPLLDIGAIATATGLSIAEVQQLKAEQT